MVARVRRAPASFYGVASNQKFTGRISPRWSRHRLPRRWITSASWPSACADFRESYAARFATSLPGPQALHTATTETRNRPTRPTRRGLFVERGPTRKAERIQHRRQPSCARRGRCLERRPDAAFSEVNPASSSLIGRGIAPTFQNDASSAHTRTDYSAVDPQVDEEVAKRRHTNYVRSNAPQGTKLTDRTGAEQLELRAKPSFLTPAAIRPTLRPRYYRQTPRLTRLELLYRPAVGPFPMAGPRRPANSRPQLGPRNRLCAEEELLRTWAAHLVAKRPSALTSEAKKCAVDRVTWRKG